jgi:hypothetical protein
MPDKSGTGTGTGTATAKTAKASLEDALARFDEQVSRQKPDIIRKRLKKGLSDVVINITPVSGS